ncbi:MAG: hypothetical protein L0220_21835 [Acidobacteria bacterium]|nr:hypothetical protein [Acidobacteriota bacterium]
MPTEDLSPDERFARLLAYFKNVGFESLFLKESPENKEIILDILADAVIDLSQIIKPGSAENKAVLGCPSHWDTCDDGSCVPPGECNTPGRRAVRRLARLLDNLTQAVRNLEKSVYKT